MKAALALLLAACATDAPVVAYVHVADPERSLEGIEVWEAIGFRVSLESWGLPECDSPDPSCQISLGYVEGAPTRADRDTRTMYIAPELAGFRRCVARAHEAGHILLDTSEHVEGGVMGGVDCQLNDADRELACRTIGACP